MWTERLNADLIAELRRRAENYRWMSNDYEAGPENQALYRDNAEFFGELALRLEVAVAKLDRMLAVLNCVETK